MDKQCSSCGGFCGEVCEREDVEALKLALEALEWSYGGEPMPSKELEAINAIRQALKDQKGNEMTDLRQAAEMALKAIDEGWLFERIDNEVAPALRQALAEPPNPDLLNQTCCGCERTGGYALYCGWCWEKGTYK